MSLHLADSVKDYIADNPKLFHTSISTTYPELAVLKYSRSVFYNAIWNDITRSARGLVIERATNKIIVHPFTKVFNVSESPEQMESDDEVDVVRKINGFMASVSWSEKYDTLVSTTGSLDSDFVQYAKDKLGDLTRINKSLTGLTLLFEIIHENDPHIIAETPGAYLIGVRENGTDCMWSEQALDGLAAQMQYLRPEHLRMRYREATVLAKRATHEGYMLRRVADNFTLKIKSPHYLVTKFFARKGEAKLLKLLASDASIASIKEMNFMEEEYYDLLHHLYANKELIAVLDEQDKVSLIRKFLLG